MNINKDAQRVIYDLMLIPGPAGGSASSSAAGFVGHSRDAKKAMHYAADIIMGFWTGDRKAALALANTAAGWLKWRRAASWDLEHAGQDEPTDAGAHEPGIVPPGVECVIYTGRLDYRGSDRLDITRQGNDRLLAAGQPTPGDLLAPSHQILWPAKKALEAARTDIERDRIFAAYRAAYLDELRERYKTRRPEFVHLVDAPYQTLVCFCTDPRWCHRVPAGQTLEAVSRGRAIYLGECEAMPTAQMRLICIR